MNKNHILVIEVDDELPDIYEKLKATKEKLIHMFVPRNAILLQSIVNLKILKRKVDELGKEVTLMTKDKKSIQLIESVGFQVEEEKNVGDAVSTRTETVQAKTKKPSIWQMIRAKTERQHSPEQGPYVFAKPSRQPLITFISVSVIVFFFILYIALPSATIYIKPTLKIQKSSLNLELISKDRIGKIVSEDDRSVGLTRIEVDYERTIKLSPTGRTFKGGSSTGQITLLNKSRDAWPIVANSRLQSPEGIVFTTKYFVTVPGGSSANPGKIVVDVVARDKDANGLFIGSRGNIGPSTFILPALSSFNQALLTGQSTVAFTGGSDAFDYFVTASDLTVAKQKIVSELEVSAVAELKKAVQGKNPENSEAFLLFDRSDKMIQKQQLEAQVRAREGDTSSSFEAWGKMHASGYYYAQGDLEKILLRNLTQKHLSPTEKILKIKEHSLQIDEILEVTSDIPRVKINASLEGIVAYDFFNNTSDLIQRIKETVIGKNKKDAETYVNNQKEISEAWITIWPIWSPTLPTIPENIKVQIQE